MLNGIITPLSAHPLLTFCARLLYFSKNASLFKMAICREQGNEGRSCKRAGVQSLALMRASCGLRTIIRASNITFFDPGVIWGELSSEVTVATEDSWYQSDWVMNGSTVLAGNTKPGGFDASE